MTTARRKLVHALVALLMAVAVSCGGRSDPEPQAGPHATTGAETEAPTAGTDARDNRSKSGAKKAETKGDAAAGSANAGPSSGGSGSGSSEGTGGGSGGSTGGRATSGAVAAPADAGTYSYDTNGRRRISGGSEERFPETTTLDIRAPEGNNQYSRRDLRDSDGNGTVTETILVYTHEGVRLAYLKITSHFGSGLTDVREFRPDPPVMLAPAGARPGDVVRFTLRGSGTTVRVTVKIRQRQTINIGGSPVEAQVVSIDAVFSGALEGGQHTLAWIDPDSLLTVREQVETDVRNGPVELHSEYQATMKSTEPQ